MHRPGHLSAGFRTAIVFNALIAFHVTAVATEEFPENAADGETTALITDYSVCRTCDIHSAEDTELRSFAEMIAEFRSNQRGLTSGLMEIKNGEGVTAKTNPSRALYSI